MVVGDDGIVNKRVISSTNKPSTPFPYLLTWPSLSKDQSVIACFVQHKP